MNFITDRFRSRRLLVSMLCALLLALWAEPASAQITFDATSNSGTTEQSAGTLTFSATVNSGSNRILCVCATGRDGSAVSAVSWNGSEALTKAVEKNATNGLISSLWYITAPTATTANVVITAAGETFTKGVAVSLFGVKQSSPVEDTDAIETTAANPSLTGLTTITNGAAVIDCMQSNETSAITMNSETNRVSRANFIGGSLGRYGGASTIITKTTAGAVTMGWTIAANNASQTAIAVTEAGAAPTTANRRTIAPRTGTRSIP